MKENLAQGVRQSLPTVKSDGADDDKAQQEMVKDRGETILFRYFLIPASAPNINSHPTGIVWLTGHAVPVLFETVFPGGEFL